MARILLVVALIAVTVYALSDWAIRSRSWTPGRVNRWVWLAVIVLLPLIGPLAWIITGLVTRAESSGEASRQSQSEAKRPDDDPGAISDLADRISRREKRSRPPRSTQGRASDPDPLGPAQHEEKRGKQESPEDED